MVATFAGFLPFVHVKLGPGNEANDVVHNIIIIGGILINEHPWLFTLLSHIRTYTHTQCWETSIGQEFYKLGLTNFAISAQCQHHFCGDIQKVRRNPFGISY